MDKKIFSLAKMQTGTEATIFIKCPEIQVLNSEDVNQWIEHFAGILENTRGKEIEKMYEYCLGFLKMVKKELPESKIWGVYNVPCSTGNEIMFVVKFRTREDRETFFVKLEELENEFLDK